MEKKSPKSVKIESEPYIGYNSSFAVLTSFTLWGLYYLTIRYHLFPTREPEYCIRILTLTHGMLMAYFGLNECLLEESLIKSTEEPSTQDQAFIIVGSLGYFLDDLIWCMYYQTETNLMVAHHFYSCFTIARILFKGVSGHQVACGLGALEVTNPLLQLRWFIRTHGYHDTYLFIAVEFVFILTFFFMRIVLGSFFILSLIFYSKTSWEFFILSMIIYIMSWMFMVNIAKYFFNRYTVKETIEPEITIEAELGNVNSS